MQQIRSDYAEAADALLALRARREAADKELHDLSNFIDRNHSALVAETENELIKELARRILDGEDELDLVSQLRQRGQADPAMMIARARLYAAHQSQRS